jgi:hypothetical protein
MTQFGRYEHLRVPFGLAYGRETLYRLVIQFMQGLRMSCCFVLCDDFLLYSQNYTDHLRDVETVLDRVRAMHVTVCKPTMKVAHTMELSGCQHRYRIKKQKQRKPKNSTVGPSSTTDMGDVGMA